ncbi:MAG: helix-turn-helix transcriptional regulator [Bacilli bacterium]|nr:helix-turn-helix transcriptional regulator [Bacilli bacterium]
MIGQRIKEERLEQHISLKALAIEVGISPSALSQIENNKRSFSIKVLLKIADALSITPNDILGRNEGVTINHTNYTIYLSKKELEILNEIKKYEKLYRVLSSSRGKENIKWWAKRIS